MKPYSLQWATSFFFEKFFLSHRILHLLFSEKQKYKINGNVRYSEPFFLSLRQNSEISGAEDKYICFIFIVPERITIKNTQMKGLNFFFSRLQPSRLRLAATTQRMNGMEISAPFRSPIHDSSPRRSPQDKPQGIRKFSFRRTMPGIPPSRTNPAPKPRRGYA